MEPYCSPTVQQNDTYYVARILDLYSDFDNMEESTGLDTTRKVFVDALNTVNDFITSAVMFTVKGDSGIWKTKTQN